MDRRALLRELIDSRYDGNVAAFARAIRKAPAQVHQWLSGHRSLGDAGARHIEMVVPGLWQGYFDGARPPTALADANLEPGPPIHTRVPLISWTTAGNWTEMVQEFDPRAAEDWIPTTAKVGPRAFALRIRGESMQPTIPDGALIVVDPDTTPKHRSVVVARQNGNEATCKRLIYEGTLPTLRADNPAWAQQAIPLADDAQIIGVVRQVVLDLE